MDLSFYVFAGIGLFGFLLILISFLLGEVGNLGGVEVEPVVDAGGIGGDHSADLGDTDAPGPLSTRILSIFLTAFGTVAAGARLAGANPLSSALLGLGAGYLLGWCVWRLLRLLWMQEGSSVIRLQDMERCIGTTTVSIPAAGPGQVACVVDGVRSYQIARSANGVEIPLGSAVRIVQVTPEALFVEPLEERDAQREHAVKKERTL